MGTISEHQVIAAYLEQNLGEKYRSVPNTVDKIQTACLDVFTFYNFKVDLSAEENVEKFKAFVLQYKKIAKKIQDAKSNWRKSVYHKFPDATKLFYSPDPDTTFITQQQHVAG